MSGQDSQWLKVDLGRVKNIGRVKLDWDTEYARSYRLELSSDGINWTTLYTMTAGDGGIDDLAVLGSGRYLRLYCTERGTSAGYSLWEMEIFEALGWRPRRP